MAKPEGISEGWEIKPDDSEWPDGWIMPEQGDITNLADGGSLI